VDKLILGDLCQIYRHVVMDKGIVGYSELTDTQFSEMMDQVALFRNKLAHTGASLKGWDDLYDFCGKFIPI